MREPQFSSTGRSLVLRGRLTLIAARHGAERDRQAIPGVDRDHRQRQIDQFALTEVLARTLEDLVGNVILPDLSDGFGPLQGGVLALGKERRFAPGAQSVDPLLGFALGARPWCACPGSKRSR